MGSEHFVATLALVGIVIVAAALLSGAVERSGLPQVAIFLLVGVALGPSGLGLLDIGLESPTLQVISTVGLVLVLFSDAIAADVPEIRRRRRLALLILGPGTLGPAVLIALAAWLLLGVGAASAAILGAALASTDPVLLRNLLRHRSVPATTKLALRLESGMNDVVLLPVVVLAMLALASQKEIVSGAEVARHVVGLFLLGPALGAAVGWLGITVLDRVRRGYGVRRDYESLYALGLALTAYAAAEGVGGSGFLAAFAAGLVVVMLDVELCDCFLDYGEASAEMFLLLTFVAFGTGPIWRGLAVVEWRTLVFVAVALGVRTAVLYPVLARAGVERGDRALIAWFGPRGLSSLLLVLLPVFAGVPGADYLFGVASLVVIVSVVLHGGGIAVQLQRMTRGDDAATITGTTATVAVPGARARPPRAALPQAATPAGDNGRETAAAAAARTPETITLDEVRELETRGEAVVIVDARTARSRDGDRLQARGSVRIPPDDAVRSARAIGLAQHATLVVYCA